MFWRYLYRSRNCLERGVRGALEEVLGARFLHDTPLVEKCDAAGGLACETHLVRHHGKSGSDPDFRGQACRFPGREAFFVELGWSRKARFPQLAMRPSGIRPNDAGSEEEYLCRLGELSRGNDFGWLVEELRADATPEEMMAYIVAQTKPIAARVVPRVAEALRELVRYGLPFLRKHAEP